MAIDDAAPVLQTATVDAHAITLTYDEPLYDSKPPPSTAFSVKVDGIASTIRSTQVNQLAVKLYLHDPVGAATVTLDYTVPPWNTGRISRPVRQPGRCPQRPSGDQQHRGQDRSKGIHSHR